MERQFGWRTALSIKTIALVMQVCADILAEFADWLIETPAGNALLLVSIAATVFRFGGPQAGLFVALLEVLTVLVYLIHHEA